MSFVNWPQLRRHEKQIALYTSKARFVGVLAGRGSGKSEIAKRRLIREFAIKRPWNDPPRFLYCLPTYKQAKRVIWESLKRYTPKEWIEKILETDLEIRLKNGGICTVVGCDKPHRIEGNQYDFVVVDESSDQKEGLFEKTIVPTLQHKLGTCWRIGVPKRFGIGAASFREFLERGERGECLIPGDETTKIETYHWRSDSVVDAKSIALVQGLLSRADFEEQLGGKWGKADGLCYDSFDEVIHESKDVGYYPESEMLVGCDFNISPMGWVIGHKVGNAIIIFDEIYEMNCNTQRALGILQSRYAAIQKAQVIFYGDASSKARKTSATTSDYIQIKNLSGFKLPPRVIFPNANPPVKSRIASVNNLFKNAKGDVRLFIHPRCKNLLRDLKTQGYKNGEPEKTDTIGHVVDGLGYLVHTIFPMQIEGSLIRAGIITNG